MTTNAVKNEAKQEDELVSSPAKPLEVVAPPSNTHLVRQPVFDRKMDVYAYNLVYGQCREGEVLGSGASSQVMLNAFLDIGIETISEGRLSIIKITGDFVEERLPLHSLRMM